MFVFRWHGRNFTKAQRVQDTLLLRFGDRTFLKNFRLPEFLDQVQFLEVSPSVIREQALIFLSCSGIRRVDNEGCETGRFKLDVTCDSENGISVLTGMGDEICLIVFEMLLRSYKYSVWLRCCRCTFTISLCICVLGCDAAVLALWFSSEICGIASIFWNASSLGAVLFLFSNASGLGGASCHFLGFVETSNSPRKNPLQSKKVVLGSGRPAARTGAHLEKWWQWERAER